MTNPWDEKRDDTRTEDTKPTFIIFCEDGEIEPNYFYCFKTPKIQIYVERNKGANYRQVNSVMEYCKEKDLIETINGKEKLKINDGAQVWCVFDRDKEENDGKDSSFTNSIDEAESKGFKTAWSNDAFELWILLHFEDIELSNEDAKHRKHYYERLTLYLKGLTNPTESLTRALEHSSFGYKKDCKSKLNFNGIILPLITDKTDIAIERAKQLEVHHNLTQKPHQKAPCTMVHKLVEELIRLGNG